MLYESAEVELAVAFGIATLRFRAGSTWRPLLFAIDDALTTVDGHPGVDVLVIREFHLLPGHTPQDESFSIADAVALSRLDRFVRQRITNLSIPTVAYLDGPVTGTILAFAHACQWRTASGRASIGTDQERLSAGQALRLHLLDRAWPDNMAEVHLLALELDLQQRSCRPRRRSMLSTMLGRRRSPKIGIGSAVRSTTRRLTTNRYTGY